MTIPWWVKLALAVVPQPWKTSATTIIKVLEMLPAKKALEVASEREPEAFTEALRVCVGEHCRMPGDTLRDK
jgi:hypothetical protein